MHALLEELEKQFGNFYEFFQNEPARTKRTLFSTGGKILKYVFGTATSADVEKIQDTLLGGQNVQSDMVHAISSQISYVKEVDSDVKSNIENSMTLAGTVKATVRENKAAERKVQLTFHTLNETLWNLTRATSVIRGLNIIVTDFARCQESLLWLGYFFM